MNLTAGDWRRWLIFWWLTGEAGPADRQHVNYFTTYYFTLYSIFKQFTEVGLDWSIICTVNKSNIEYLKLYNSERKYCSLTNEHEHNSKHHRNYIFAGMKRQRWCFKMWGGSALYLSEEDPSQSLYCCCALTSDPHHPPLWPWSSGCSGTCTNNKSSSYRSVKMGRIYFFGLQSIHKGS